MKKYSKLIVLSFVFFIVLSNTSCISSQETFSYTLSMNEPNTHIYNVVFRCEGLTGDAQDFKMPAWTPGYYGLMNYANNVQNFHVVDGQGTLLKWEKTTANCWHVRTGAASTIVVSYDVLANRSFVANSYLDENRGYIMPASVFMYVGGQIQHPVMVKINLNPKWSTIATGLDPVLKDNPHTFYAPDYDILYDSPILMGNLEQLPKFEIKGVPHYFYGYNMGNFDKELFIKELKAVVEAGIDIIGDIPYKHFTFISIGSGQGGIEHLNSTSFGFSGSRMNNRASRNSTLNFLAHEYFHTYNVKRIRPIALGPFDYDKENLTNMLWVSEGFTVYYEYLMLARAGFMTQEDVLNSLTRTIAGFENNTGHLFQSATQSSFDSWSQGPFGGRGGSGIRKTISYYDKGASLGLLLDFKIRYETKNKKSLDDVMRTLYYKFYKEKKRGFTDQEFRDVCEQTAGCKLDEIFEYASTTRDIDYNKYLSYAGLELEKPKELDQAWFGAIVEDKDGKLIITAVEGDSPAKAKLIIGDQIKIIDGNSVNAGQFNEIVASKKPQDKVKLNISHADKELNIEIILANKIQRSFRIQPISNPDQLQSEILKSWLKK